MKPQLFYRSIRARDMFEIFLIAAVSSLLLLRFYLEVAGYPQVGGATLHIAHMLYGGLFMAASIIILLTFLGARVQRFCALLGGVGFGIFIDELGKFITKDNNYFFQPTIGLIYAVFIVMYLTVTFITRSNRYTSREYELNALAQFEEAVLQDLDPVEKNDIRALLAKADNNSVIARELTKLLDRIETVTVDEPGLLKRFTHFLDKSYEKFWTAPQARNIVSLIFLAQAIYLLVATIVTAITQYHPVTRVLEISSYSNFILVGQFTSAAVAAGCAVYASIKLLSSRRKAFEWFSYGLLINLFLTEFFLFSRIQFGAMPSFIATLILLVGLRYSQHEEQRTRVRA